MAGLIKLMLLAIIVITTEQITKTIVIIRMLLAVNLVAQGIYTARLSPPRLTQSRKRAPKLGCLVELGLVTPCGRRAIQRRTKPSKPVIQVGKNRVKVFPIKRPRPHKKTSDETTLTIAVDNLYWLMMKSKAINVSVLMPINSVTRTSKFSKILTPIFE